MDDCPICYEEISGTVTHMGCCRKSMHAACYVKCMVRKTECPMCRADQHFEIESESEPEEVVTDYRKFSITLLSMGMGMLFSRMPITIVPSISGIVLGGLLFRP